MKILLRLLVLSTSMSALFVSQSQAFWHTDCLHKIFGEKPLTVLLGLSAAGYATCGLYQWFRPYCNKILKRPSQPTPAQQLSLATIKESYNTALKEAQRLNGQWSMVN